MSSRRSGGPALSLPLRRGVLLSAGLIHVMQPGPPCPPTLGERSQGGSGPGEDSGRREGRKSESSLEEGMEGLNEGGWEQEQDRSSTCPCPSTPF